MLADELGSTFTTVTDSNLSETLVSSEISLTAEGEDSYNQGQEKKKAPWAGKKEKKDKDQPLPPYSLGDALRRRGEKEEKGGVQRLQFKV